MKSYSSPRNFTPLRTLAVLLLALPPMALAINLTEDFNGTDLDPTIWESTGDKSRTVSAGKLTWNAGGGNWSSGDISSVSRFYLPPTGQTTVIEWTLAPGAVSVTDSSGNSIRMQLGIHSANETAARREHWPNTTGGVWLDLDGIRPDTLTSVAGAYRSANNTKVANSQAAFVAGANSAWSWQTSPRVHRLELTADGYTWFDEGVQTATQDWASAGIDTELQNGYRVLALGMNFNAGRGTTALEKIQVTNAFGNLSLISNYTSGLSTAISGQPVTLNWVVDPAATVAIDQGVGPVNAQTTAGVGSVRIIAPDVTVPTAVDYILTTVKGAQTATRTVTLNVQPAPPLFMDNFMDDFLGDTLDMANWEHRGGKTYAVSDSRINWNADGGDWDTGELGSTNIYPLPPAGKTTIITWNIGPATATTQTNAGATNALRPQFGIVSAFQPTAGGLQQWPNTAGGLWIDITNMASSRISGVSGRVNIANDTKTASSDGPQLSLVDIADWNWTTENHLISLEVTDQGFTWKNGATDIFAGTWAANGIDTEFSKGFRVMFMAGNWEFGRGPMSLDTITVSNGAAPSGGMEISGVTHDPVLDRTVVSFPSVANTNYALDASTSLSTGTWSQVSAAQASGAMTSLTHTAATGTRMFYRVRNVDLRPVP